MTSTHTLLPSYQHNHRGAQLRPLDGAVLFVSRNASCLLTQYFSSQKVHEMLKKGWDIEGSPFKGQQFDPSMFDIPPGAVQF